MSDFSLIENDFLTLFDKLAGTVLSAAEIDEIRHFVSVGEYGLALETAIDILLDKKTTLPPDILAIFERMAVCMEIDCFDSLSMLRQ